MTTEAGGEHDDGPEPEPSYKQRLAHVAETVLPAAPLVLQARYNVDPGDTGVLLDLAAMALTHSCWRNSAWEHAHAAGAIDDADQIASNIDAWRIVRAHMSTARDWTPCPPPLSRTLVDAQRGIAGRTLSQRLRGTAIRTDGLRREVRDKLWSRTFQAEDFGSPEETLPLWALSGAVTCDRWFGTPWWPQRCATYWATLPHEAADGLGTGAEAAQRLLALPGGLERLTTAPELLDHQARDDLIMTGLSYVRLPDIDKAIDGIPNGTATLTAAVFLGT